MDLHFRVSTGNLGEFHLDKEAFFSRTDYSSAKPHFFAIWTTREVEESIMLAKVIIIVTREANNNKGRQPCPSFLDDSGDTYLSSGINPSFALIGPTAARGGRAWSSNYESSPLLLLGPVTDWQRTVGFQCHCHHAPLNTDVISRKKSRSQLTQWRRACN